MRAATSWFPASVFGGIGIDRMEWGSCSFLVIALVFGNFHGFENGTICCVAMVRDIYGEPAWLLIVERDRVRCLERHGWNLACYPEAGASLSAYRGSQIDTAGGNNIEEPTTATPVATLRASATKAKTAFSTIVKSLRLVKDPSLLRDP